MKTIDAKVQLFDETNGFISSSYQSTPSFSTLGQDLIREMAPGEWMWHGAAIGRDGNIYAIPANAERVLKIEPATNRVYCIGPTLHPGLTSKWYGGIKALDGSIWGMPYNAPSALKIVPETGEVIEVGRFARGGWKWHGGLRRWASR